MERKKVLIAEDDPDERLGLHLRLKDSGYETFLAEDGIGCMTEARKHKPDLILLDIRMPAGSGFVVLDRLKRIPELAVIPVIVISVRDASSFRQRVLDAGAKAFLQKPVDAGELLATVRHHLGETREEPAVYNL